MNATLVVVFALSAVDPSATAPSRGAPAPAAPPTAVVTTQLPAPRDDGRRAAPTTTPLMARHVGRLVVTTSSTWPGWGPERLIDGDPATSWFSNRGDAAALGKKPWVAVRFPVDVTVARVAVLGNREPSWPKGFSIHYGVVDLLDGDGKVLATTRNEAKNTLADVDFKLRAPVPGVRVVRFTSLMDDGDKTQFQDIAFGELLVE